MKKLRFGMVGTGFGYSFMQLLKMHPYVEKVVAADMNETRRRERCDPLGIESYDTMDEMLAKNPDLDSVGIFAERHLHGRLIVDALKKGLHVLSAVPVAVDLDDMREIISLVEKTRLTFMTAETCFYFPDAVFCREEYKKGTFGRFVFGQAAYYHDISEFTFMAPDQRGIPPMFYPTHSMTMLFGAADDLPRDVCCFGDTDMFDDRFYGKDNNIWDNPFANETAIFHMSKGGIACINEYRRVGKNKPSSVISCFRGTKASYDTAGRTCFMDYGNLPHLGQTARCEDVGDRINTIFYNNDKGARTLPTSYAYSVGYSECQNISRMPRVFRELQSPGKTASELMKLLGHNGTHPLLVDDFVRAVTSGKLPPNNAWESSAHMVPGLIAHESALAGGVTMKIPDLGAPPADWEALDCSQNIYDD